MTVHRMNLDDVTEAKIRNQLLEELSHTAVFYSSVTTLDKHLIPASFSQKILECFGQYFNILHFDLLNNISPKFGTNLPSSFADETAKISSRHSLGLKEVKI